MTKYIVKDWAGNVMNWGQWTDEDDAHEAIRRQVEAELKRLYVDYSSGYYIDEIDEHNF